MRGFLNFVAAIMVMGLAYWAYSENYKTQDALRQATNLQRLIGAERERLSVLEAEWAYLNRPERLSDLASLNFERLQLMPIMPEQFGLVSDVVPARPDGGIISGDLTGAVAVSSSGQLQE